MAGKRSASPGASGRLRIPVGRCRKSSLAVVSAWTVDAPGSRLACVVSSRSRSRRAAGILRSHKHRVHLVARCYRPKRVRRQSNPMAAAVAAGLLVLGLSGCQGSTSQHASADLRSPDCASGSLRLSLTHPFSPITGEHGRLFALTNHSGSSCVLDGSPRIGLSQHGRQLPFVYRYPARHGGGSYVSEQPPRRVLLRSGSVAYFLVAKYRCDGGASGEASEIRIFLPGNTTPLRRTLSAAGGGFGVSALDYCHTYPGDEPVDPGNWVDVSPITASPSAVFGSTNVGL